MSTRRLWWIGVATLAGLMAAAMSTRAQSRTYGLGHSPTPGEIAAWALNIGPDGEGLPPGSGTAAEGKPVYNRNCAVCHGATGKEGPDSILVGGRATLDSERPLKTVGSYWPYATTLWDYVNRAMPLNLPGSLAPDEVYAVVAYVLYLNDVVGEEDRLDAETLPQVRMPNRDGFIPDPRPDTGARPGP